MATPVQVLPVTSATDQRSDKSPWIYKLCPPDPLPTLDLSISIKSRFLSRAALNRFNCFVAWRKAIGLAGFVALVFYPLVIMSRAEVGQICAITSTLLLAPTIIAAVAFFRYDVVKLLLRSYDFWFATVINTSTFAVFAIMMGDIRFLVPISAWTGIQVNIMIDASLRAVKVWQFLNIVGVVTHTMTWAIVSLQVIDRLRVFPVFRYKSHELPSSSFVTSGLATLIAIIIRNVYRKRHESSKRSNRLLIECVSYRTDLQYCSYPLGWQQRPNTIQSLDTVSRPEYVKTMRCHKETGVIDPQLTLWQIPIVFASSASTRFTKFISWLGVMSASLSVTSVLYDGYAQPLIHPAVHVPVAQLFALLFTVIYCGICAMHYQRRLLVVLFTSFDFVFLAIQLTIVHVGMCDLLCWNRSCIFVLVSWIWFHWVLCLDALTPIMKAKLGLQRHFALAVPLIFASSSLVLMYYMIFADDTIEVFDRVMLTHNMLGHQVDFRVLPFFYNCYVTALMLVLRLIWRLVFNKWDVLLVVDGVVVYENYLRTATNRVSRRWGSVLQANREATLISPAIQNDTSRSKIENEPERQ
uniref:Uncharacterized protein n=1 Tax=Globisporangium ultimum (strain ATCC 200006 / CBS 805.95 / DAOM BR144) TaxID=431595 RepID=K3WU20_GLOUD